ncbi:MAG: hypothetical protein NC417_08925 [Candidatus Gastranaerophilales bacterium]|nr:hypothetical protein [Candidatus Gastranaerophilales bacterium]
MIARVREMAGEREIFRAKKENFQELLDYKKSFKGSGCLTIKHDWNTGEYVLVHSDKRWAASIIENIVKMKSALENFEEYLAVEERA